MTTMTSSGDTSIDTLYAVRKGSVAFIDVPELGFVAIDGRGAPGGKQFSAAVQALYSVSYGAHFTVKKDTGQAPRVMPLEALWWIEGLDAQLAMERLAAGQTTVDETERDQWRWRAMIMQPAPIDEPLLLRVIGLAKAKKDIAALEAVVYERWTEGPSAQIMHVGPYASESSSIVNLHHAIAAHRSRPRGRHHEIYLGDPRTTAPERLRTILRQPIEPAS